MSLVLYVHGKGGSAGESDITDSFLKAVMFMVLIINQRIHGMQKRSFLQNSRNCPQIIVE